MADMMPAFMALLPSALPSATWHGAAFGCSATHCSACFTASSMRVASVPRMALVLAVIALTLPGSCASLAVASFSASANFFAFSSGVYSSAAKA